MTVDELGQHVIDIVKASGYTGAAVFVLVWKDPKDEVQSVIGTNLETPESVAAVLEMAAELTRAGKPDRRLTMTPHATPEVEPS